MAGLDGLLRQLRAQEITFTFFQQSTRDDWRRMALKLFRIWELPPGVTAEDVEQEMLLAAWTAVRDWDPDRPGAAGLRSFVVWRAHNAAAKWLHAQRRAKRHDGKAPSRFARAVGGMAINPQRELAPAELIDLFASVPADQEQVVDARRILGRIPGRATTEEGQLAMWAWILSEGDVELAGRELFDDWALRLRYEWGAENDAVRVVRRELRGLQESLNIEEVGS